MSVSRAVRRGERFSRPSVCLLLDNDETEELFSCESDLTAVVEVEEEEEEEEEEETEER